MNGPFYNLIKIVDFNLDSRKNFLPFFPFYHKIISPNYSRIPKYLLTPFPRNYRKKINTPQKNLSYCLLIISRQAKVKEWKKNHLDEGNIAVHLCFFLIASCKTKLCFASILFYSLINIQLFTIITSTSAKVGMESTCRGVEMLVQCCIQDLFLLAPLTYSI